MQELYVIIDTFNSEMWNICTDEEGKTLFFTSRENAIKYHQENLQEGMIIRYQKNCIVDEQNC